MINAAARTFMKFFCVCCFLMTSAAGAHSAADETTCKDAYAFVSTTDYATGSSSTISLDDYSATINVASIHSDAVARYYKGLIYVVNRYGADNIQLLDPCDNFSTVRQFSVGSGSNPKDIAVVGETKAYVTRHNNTDLWIVNPSTGDHTGSIDLSVYADADGFPEMDQMCVVGSRLFITIQRLDRDYYWLPVGTSYIAVVDATADTLIDTDLITPGKQPITLTGTNPYSDLQLNPYTGKLYVSCVGEWGSQDGGVEVIDPDTYQSGGFILTESAAGGDIEDVEIVAPDKGYVIIMDSGFLSVMLSFDPETGAILNTLYAPGEYCLQDVELAPTGDLFLADRKATNPGIRVYDISSDAQKTTTPIDVGLPPYDITFNVTTPTGIETKTPLIASLGWNFPNPFNPTTTIPFTLGKGAFVRLVIYDVTGRLVRTLLEEKRSAGDHRVLWDGRDDGSHMLPSGVYLARLEAEGFVASRKLLLLK